MLQTVVFAAAAATLLSSVALATPAVPEIGEGVPVNPGIFGLNNNNASAGSPHNGPAYAALIEGLGANFARYVGGSSASFWDWRTGKYVPVEEITTIWPAEHGNWMLPLVADVAKLEDGTLGPPAYADFADAAGVKVQWLLNLTTREEDQPPFIDYLAEQGVDADYFELDNETYFWGGEFGHGKQRGENYIARVNQLVPHIRETFPDARVGIVASENGMFVDDMHKEGEAFMTWNDTIMDSRDNFDALILHHYVMTQGALDHVDGGAAEYGRAFLTTPQVTLDHAARVLAEQYDGLPMWITEFNVIGYYRIGNPNDEKPDTGITDADAWIKSTQNTAWNALYQAGFWVSAMNHPEAIEILNHHSVTNTGLGWGLGQPVSTSEAQLTDTGQIFAHLAHLAADAETMHAVTFAENPVLPNAFEGAEAHALHGAALNGPDGVTLIVINRHDAAVPVELPDGATVLTYHADEDTEDLVTVDLAKPTWEQGPMTPTAATVAGGSHNLPGFSLSIVSLP